MSDTKRNRSLSPAVVEQVLDPGTWLLFLWWLGDGRRGRGTVRLPSLTGSASWGNAATTLSTWRPDLCHVTEEKVLLPLDLEAIEALLFWEVSQDPMGIVGPLPEFFHVAYLSVCPITFFLLC